MRIVEYGYIKPKEVKCNHCGAILEYVPQDLKEKNFHGKQFVYLACPVCKLNIPSDNDGNKFTLND